MKLKKSIFLLSLLPFLCNCSLFETFSWSQYVNSDRYMELESPKFKNYKFDDNFDAIEKKKNKLNDTIKNGSSSSAFVSALNDVYKSYTRVVNDRNVAEAKYYANPTEETKNYYDLFYDEYKSIQSYLYDLEKDIAESSSVIKKAYFGDMTDEEIAQRVDRSEKKSEATTYTTLIDNLEIEGEETYDQLANGEITREEYLEKAYDIYFRMLEPAAKVAELYGYGNYIDYRYNYYFSRDYMSNDGAEFSKNLKEYLLPIFLEKEEIEAPNNVDLELFDSVNSVNFCNANNGMYKAFKSYAIAMGGDFLQRYNHLWKNGYYCFTGRDNCYGTAYVNPIYDQYFYTTDCIVYFSKSNQSIMNVIHEFGHYYAITCDLNLDVNVNAPMDISETHSQANEYTFLNYLCNHFVSQENYPTYKYYADYKIYDNLWYLVNFAVIIEIENFVFKTANLTKETMIEGIEKILDSYQGGASQVYWAYPCISSSGYYISYATSLIESLLFYSYEFEESKDLYMNFVHNLKNGCVDTWVDNGLTSPFEKETFEQLAGKFQEISDRY